MSMPLSSTYILDLFSEYENFRRLFSTFEEALNTLEASLNLLTLNGYFYMVHVSKNLLSI